MASFIKIKRSTGTLAPASIQYGELAYTTGVGTHGNGGGKLFVGDNVPNAVAVGGRYYTDLLSIAPGLVAGQTNPTTAANGFVAILDQNRKVDQWNVDNLTLDLNTLSSTNVDGDIIFDPNGSGEVLIPDDTYLTFGTSKDTKIRYDEATDDRLEVTGADWNFANGVAISISDNTQSTTTSTGAVIVTGGVGIGSRLNVAGDVDFDGDFNVDGGDVTSNTASLNLFNTTVARSNVLGAGTNIVFGATTGITTIRNSILDLDGDLNIDGGDLTSNASTFNLLNENSTTINAFYGATSVGIGSISNTSTVTIRSTKESTSSSTGALVVSGGVGVSGNLSVNGSVNIEGGITGTISTATIALTVDTTTAPNGTYYPGLFVSPTGTASTTVYVDSGISYVSNTDTLALRGDIAINGGDATTSSSTFNLINANATNINFGGAATAIVIGATSGITTIRNPTLVGTQATQNLYNTVSTNLNFGGAATALVIGSTSGIATINNPTVVGSQTTQNLYNSVATTVNAFGQATTIGIGSTAATLTLRPSTVVGSQTTQNLYNSVATNLNFAGAATALNMGATTGIATINNVSLTLPNATTVNVNGANPTLAASSTGTLTLFNANITRVNAFQAATDIVLSATTGITTVRNKLTVGGNLEIDGNGIQASDGNTNITLTSNTLTTFAGDIRVNGNDIQASDGNTNITLTSNTLTTFAGDIRVNGNDIQSSTGAKVITLISNNATFANDITVQGNTNLGNSSTDQVTILGNVNHTGISTNVGGIYVDAIGISSNAIYTRPGTGDKLYIDPYPDGLSNEGVVIIKGDLQVDGTTTTVNSITVTSNNPIYVVGDNATTRTVITTAASGNLLTIDSVAGISTNDVVTGTSIPSNTVISGINAGTKVITLSNSITGTINSGSQITISQGVDTNDDRGIAFKYVSSGIGTEAVVKTGFFGYVDSTLRWTYVPDAGIGGNVVTGKKGFLDIKGIYYQAGDFSTNGINYFNTNGLMRSTVAPGAGINTSNYILTTDASGVPTWTDTIDGGTF
jgi:hypothetical protein